MKNNRRAKKNKLPLMLISLAIVLVAGFGFAQILGHKLNRTPDAEQVATPTSSPSPAPMSSHLPTPSPMPVITPTATPEPTEAPKTEYDEVTGALKSVEGQLTESIATTEPIATPEPTPVPGPLAGLKIGIDPGHQKKMNGDKEPVSPGSKEKKPKVASGTTGVRTKVPEYKVTLEMSLMLRDMLERLGAEVLMARETNDVDISNIERAQMMNEWGADLVLRIHCNGVDVRSKNGIGLYVTKTGSIAKDSYAAAERILPAMVAATGARKDGIFKRDIYSGLNWSEVPSILVETGYMSNPDEDEKLNDPAYQRLLCNGMAQGVADYFERELPEDWSETDAEGANGLTGEGNADRSVVDESRALD